MSVETSYQPSGLPCSAAMRPASVIRPSTSVTSAPYSSHSRMKGTFTSRRHEDLRREPRGGGVGGHRIGGVAGRRHREDLRAEMHRAGHRRGQSARLERVGRVERLVLDEDPRQSEIGADAGGVDQRRPALAQRDRRLAVEQRHQLAVAPHGRRARPASGSLLPGPGRFEIVAGEQRRAAGAQVLLDARIVGRRAAWRAAIEVSEVGHGAGAISCQLSAIRKIFLTADS